MRNPFPFLRSDVAQWDDVDVVFVVSTGRTATKFFSGFFTYNFSNIIAHHEPAPDLFDLGTQYIRGQCSHKKAVSRLKRFRHPIYQALKETGASIYLESNNNAAMMLPVIKDVFPRLKIVFVTRDPKSYLISSYSKAHGASGYTLYGATDPRPRLNATDFKDDVLAAQWDELTRFERLCWHWKTYNHLISSFLKDEPNHLVIKYEDLFEAGDFDAIKKMVTFMGAETPGEVTDGFLAPLLGKKSNESASYALPAFEQWGNELKEQFDQILGEEIEKYGYA